LWSIAQRYEVDPTVLASLNIYQQECNQAGQKLRIPGNTVEVASTNPAQEQPTYTVRSGDTLSHASQFKAVSKQLMSWNKLARPGRSRPDNAVLYVDDSRRAGG
jgi:LysM repeat protein